MNAAALPLVVVATDLAGDDAQRSPRVWPGERGEIDAGRDRDVVLGLERGSLQIILRGRVPRGAPLAALLPLDGTFDDRVATARTLRRLLTGLPAAAPDRLTAQRRGRLISALRALDGRLAHASYREIALALFGPQRVPLQGWKSHDLRSRTIRLVTQGLSLMNGGYRELLRSSRRSAA